MRRYLFSGLSLLRTMVSAMLTKLNFVDSEQSFDGGYINNWHLTVQHNYGE